MPPANRANLSACRGFRCFRGDASRNCAGRFRGDARSFRSGREDNGLRDTWPGGRTPLRSAQNDGVRTVVRTTVPDRAAGPEIGQWSRAPTGSGWRASSRFEDLAGGGHGQAVAELHEARVLAGGHVPSHQATRSASVIAAPGGSSGVPSKQK